jgi:hypothetical protein
MTFRNVVLTSLLVMICLAVVFTAAAQESGDRGVGAEGANPLKLEGKWLRPDGGYLLGLSEVGFDGSLRAAYYNPNPINVSRATWGLEEGLVVAYVELRDVNYPGSTYTLAYIPDRDILAGYYYQAVQGQTFEVVFQRQKEDR